MAENWAIDREQDCYMFSLPKMVYDGATKRPYYIYFKNRPYEIYTEGFSGGVIGFEEILIQHNPLFSKIQTAITKALRSMVAMEQAH